MSRTITRPTKAKSRSFNPELAAFRVHAFGAGVQSMELLYGHAWFTKIEVALEPNPDHPWYKGFFPLAEIPNIVIFADTQREPKYVYRAVEEAKIICEWAQIPFEIVTAGDLGRPPKASTGTQGIFTPLFTIAIERMKRRIWIDALGQKVSSLRHAQVNKESPLPLIEGVEVIEPGAKGQLRRQCTGRYKIDPMMARVYELAGDRPIEVWLGISLDEWQRVKTSTDDRITYRYPLVFKESWADQDIGSLGPMTRQDCINELESLNAPRAKSACTFCPYRSDVAWAIMQRENPEAFEDACQYDEWVRNLRPGYELYVHDSRKPLRSVIFQANDPRVLDLGIFAEADTSSSGGCEGGFCGL